MSDKLISANELTRKLYSISQEHFSLIAVRECISKCRDNRPSAERDNLRPCLVEGKKAYFHKWCERSKIIAPSIMEGGHSGGVLKFTLALIEYESGEVAEVEPFKIQFTDTKPLVINLDNAAIAEAVSSTDGSKINEDLNDETETTKEETIKELEWYINENRLNEEERAIKIMLEETNKSTGQRKRSLYCISMFSVHNGETLHSFDAGKTTFKVVAEYGRILDVSLTD